MQIKHASLIVLKLVKAFLINRQFNKKMKLKELLVSCDIDLVISEVATFHKEVNPDVDLAVQELGYRRALDELLGLKPTKDKGEILRVEKILADPLNDDKDSWHVSMGKPKSKITWSLAFKPWAQWLNMEVKTDFGPETTLTYILWELTFYGFTQKATERVGKSVLAARKKSIKKKK